MKASFAVLLVLVSFASKAQTFDIVLTERLKKASSDEIIPIGSNYIQVHPEYNRTMLPYGLGLRTVRAGFTIRKLNSQFDEILARPVSNGEKKYGPSLYQFYEINGILYLVFQELSPDNVLGSIKMARIDTTTLELTGEREIISLEAKKYKETYYSFFQSKQTDAKFMLRSSPDNNYMLFLCDLVAGKKELSDNKKMIAVVFDSNMNLVYDRQIEFNIENRQFKFHSFTLDNQGRIFIAYTKATEIAGARKKDATINASTQVAIFSREAKGPATATVPLKEYSANMVSLLTLPGSGDVVIAGAYAKDFMGLIHGVFRTSIANGSKQTGKVEMLSFPADILSGLKEDHLVAENKDGIALSTQFSQYLLLRDGDNHDFIMEHNAEVSSNLSKNPHTSYYSGSILNIAFRNGKSIFTRIPKHAMQINTNSLLSSNSLVYNDKRVFFYNEDEDNLKKELSDNASTVKNFRDAVLVAAIVDGDGHVSRRVIAKPEDNFIPTTMDLIHAGSGKYLIPLEKVRTMSYSGQRKYMMITVK
jgi:hypothetical protein